MSISYEDAYVLSPEWDLRRNGSRAMLLKLDLFELQYVILSPLDALIVSLLDGERSLDNVSSVASYLLEIDDKSSLELVEGAVNRLNHSEANRIRPIKDLSSFEIRNYDPANFIIDSEKIDMPRRLDVPIVLGITPTHRCKTNCIYCYAERRYVSPTDELSVGEWTRIIDEAVELGIDRADLLGGDPLARKEAVDIMLYMIERGFRFFLSTKCHIDASTACRLADAGMGDRIIQISIDAPNAEMADTITKSPGFFENAIDSLNNLLAYGLRARAKGTITSYNVRQAPELLRLWYEMGIRDIMFVDYSRSYYRHNDDLYCDPEESAWLSEEVDKLKEEFSDAEIVYGAQAMGEARRSIEEKTMEEKWENWRSRARCSGGSSTIVICPDGLVTLCEQIPQTEAHIVGDIRKQGIMDIWNSQKLLDYIYPDREILRDTACYDCEDFEDCHRTSGHCFRDALFAFGTRYMPAPLCPLAPESPRVS